MAMSFILPKANALNTEISNNPDITFHFIIEINKGKCQVDHLIKMTFPFLTISPQLVFAVI